jgi:hypothetical protein
VAEQNGYHNPWSHVPLLDLFAEAGIELKATKDGKYEGAHTYRHTRHILAEAWWYGRIRAAGIVPIAKPRVMPPICW